MNKKEQLIKEFNFLKEIKSKEDVTEQRVIIFFKRILKDRNRNLLSKFCISSIPITFIDILIKSDIWEKLLTFYFTYDKNCNEDFLRIALKKSTPSVILKIIKLKQAFNHNKHWESFDLLRYNKTLIYKTAYKEFEFIKKTQEYWLDLENIYFNRLVKYNLQDILIHFTSYYQKFKNYSQKTPSNKALITSYEAILIELFDKLLIEVKTHKLKNEISNFYSINEFTQKLKNELPPLKPSPNFFPEESVSEEKKEIREIIEFYFTKYDDRYQLNKYLSGYAEFEDIDGLEAEIRTNDEHGCYRQSLEKGNYEENYITNIIDSTIIKALQSKNEFWDKELELKIQSSLKHFEFYNIPNTINYNGKSIELYKMLHILHTFSAMLFPQGRMFINDNILKRKIKEDFLELFTPNYITCFTKQELIEKIVIYFNYSLIETEAIIDFLTVNISITKAKKANIKTHPFIKIGDTIYWMSSFLKDTKWETTLYRRLWSDKEINHDTISANTEKSICSSFKEAGFNAISNSEYTYQNRQGEIDIIAFKNKTLFIIELKNTAIVEDTLKTKNYENEKFNQKASNQLHLAKEYIINNFKEISKTENLDINLPLEELTIQKLIVSNSFQADNLIINKDTLKVSLFELTIILKNDLYDVLISKMGGGLFKDMPDTPLDWKLNFSNRNSPTNKQNIKEVTKESTNLWREKSKCMPSDVIEAIVKNKVFKHLEENNKYPIEHIKLTTYDSSSKYLS